MKRGNRKPDSRGVSWCYGCPRAGRSWESQDLGWTPTWAGEAWGMLVIAYRVTNCPDLAKNDMHLLTHISVGQASELVLCTEPSMAVLNVSAGLRSPQGSSLPSHNMADLNSCGYRTAGLQGFPGCQPGAALICCVGFLIETAPTGQLASSKEGTVRLPQDGS